MVYQGWFTIRWRRVLTPLPSVAAVLVLLAGSVLTTVPASSLRPVPAAAITTTGPALDPDQPPASVTHMPAQVGPAQVVPTVPAVPAVPTGGIGIVRQALLPVGSWSVPDELLAAYRKAVAGAPATCHVSISLLAAIGQVESGSLAGRSLDTAHRVVPQVLGPLLDGVSFPAFADTDGGRLDGNPRWDRAVGPMQFIPSTWAGYGVDGDGDGQADPQNVYDATASAAGYLCAHGRDLALDSGLRSAILAYNHSDAYLAKVLDWARRFGAPSGGVTRVSDAGLTVPADLRLASLTSSASAGSGTAHPSASTHPATATAASGSPQPTSGNPATGPTSAPPGQTDPPSGPATTPTSAPGAPDAASTDPVVVTDRPGSPQPVPVVGIALSPQSGCDVGDQRLGVTSHELALTFQNPGTAPLTFTGPPALSSSEIALAGHGDCTDPIAPEGSCTVHVTFKPSELGARKGTLTMQSNAAVSLTSTDALPFTLASGAVASLTVAFAPKAVGAVTATITLNNNGPTDAKAVPVLNALPTEITFSSTSASDGVTCTTIR